MKTRLTFLLASVVSLAQAQQWSGGITVDLPLNIDRTGTTFQSGSSTFTMNDGLEANKLRPGVFVRYDRPDWLLQADVQHVPNFQIGFRAAQDRVGAGSETARGAQTTLRLTGGYKPAPWLRVQAGLGAAYTAWNATRYREDADFIDAQLRSGQPGFRPEQALYNRDVARVIDNYQPWQLTGHLGVGVDLGGLTIDFMRNQGLTPALNGVSGITEAARQNYGFYSLRAGYRLFPLRRYLLAPRKNRAYQKLKSEIPFYKNEFQVGLGLLGEDIGTGLVYENRYTRYLTRRVGFTGILGAARTAYIRPDDPNRFKAFTAFHGAIMARALPLYTRRHQIGLSAGLNVLHVTPRYSISSVYPNADGQGNNYARTNLYAARTSVGWQWQLDYQVALTDRIPIGLWLRSVSNPAFDYAYFGLQSGYRF